MSRLTSLSARLLAGAALTLAAAAVHAAPAEIEIPGGLTIPESLTSDAAGAVYIGSMANRAVLRAAPDAAVAEPFIAPGAAGLQSVFGVLADDSTDTLWVCSGVMAFGPMAGAAENARPSALHAFTLSDGAPKDAYDLPTDGATCNDIAVGPDGDVYATDTTNMEILRLAPGADALEIWAGGGAFGPTGGVLDGIAVVGGRVIVNTLATSKLFAAEVNADGSAGAVTDLALDRAIDGPDGMRSHDGDSVLVVEGGRLSQVRIDGAGGRVTTLREGFGGPVAVTVVGDVAYVLEGQFSAMMAGPGADVANGKAIAVPLD